MQKLLGVQSCKFVYKGNFTPGITWARSNWAQWSLYIRNEQKHLYIPKRAKTCTTSFLLSVDYYRWDSFHSLHTPKLMLLQTLLAVLLGKMLQQWRDRGVGRRGWGGGKGEGEKKGQEEGRLLRWIWCTTIITWAPWLTCKLHWKGKEDGANRNREKGYAKWIIFF